MKTAATSRSPPRRSVTGRLRAHPREPPGPPQVRAPGNSTRSSARWPTSSTAARGHSSRSSAVLASGCQTTWPSGPGSGRRLRPGRQGPRVHDGRTYPGPRCCGPVTEPGVNPGPAGLADPGGSGGGARPRATDGRSWAWSGPRAPARGPWPSSCWPSLRVRHEDEVGWRTSRWTAPTWPTPSCAVSGRAVGRRAHPVRQGAGRRAGLGPHRRRAQRRADRPGGGSCSPRGRERPRGLADRGLNCRQQCAASGVARGVPGCGVSARRVAC